MAKRIKQLHDKYKSTTNIYPKITMGSLSPSVKAYIDGAGDDKFVTKQEENEPYVSTIRHSGDDIVLKVEQTEDGGAGLIVLEGGEFYVTLGDDTNSYTIGLTNTGDFAVQSNENGTIHSLTFDAEGNLKVDGQAVGGKQLYQHIVMLSHADTLWVDLISDSAEPIDTKQKFIDWLVANKYDSANSGYYINFKLITQATNYPVYRIRYNNSTQKLEGYYYVSASTGGFWTDIVGAVSSSTDKVRAL